MRASEGDSAAGDGRGSSLAKIRDQRDWETGRMDQGETEEAGRGENRSGFWWVARLVWDYSASRAGLTGGTGGVSG